MALSKTNTKDLMGESYFLDRWRWAFLLMAISPHPHRYINQLWAERHLIQIKVTSTQIYSDFTWLFNKSCYRSIHHATCLARIRMKMDYWK